MALPPDIQVIVAPLWKSRVIQYHEGTGVTDAHTVRFRTAKRIIEVIVAVLRLHSTVNNTTRDFELTTMDVTYGVLGRVSQYFTM
jgi:hypothetical protein